MKMYLGDQYKATNIVFSRKHSTNATQSRYDHLGPFNKVLLLL